MGSGDVHHAMILAETKHFGQADKAGTPYFGHCHRVALRMTEDDARAVAYLHDILEDTDVTEEMLRGFFPDNVVDAVVAITRRPDESYAGYIRRLKTNPLARAVKIADLIDNSDLSRLKAVTMEDVERQAKYNKALKILLEEA